MIWKHPTPSNICAVITTFRPDVSIVECLNSISCQVGFSVIVNDSGEQFVRSQLEQWFQERSDVLVHHHSMNSGIACALNTGAKIAASRGFSWVLTLDDDSVAAPHMVQSLISTLERIPESITVGVIGMDWTRKGTGLTPLNGDSVVPTWCAKRGIITSGSLFSVELFAQIGGFREEFFIDAVDYDFCLRARKHGLRVIKVSQVGFAHNLGEPIYRKFLGQQVISSNHAPVRLYYFFRNSTVLAVEHLLSDPLYSFAVVAWYIRIGLKILIFEKDRRRKLDAIARGLRHALLGKLGRSTQADSFAASALGLPRE